MRCPSPVDGQAGGPDDDQRAIAGRWEADAARPALAPDNLGSSGAHEGTAVGGVVVPGALGLGERALATLDSALHGGGMRLALRGDRIIVVGRLEGTELSSRLSLERLTAGEMDPKLARFLWTALAGIVPERIKDHEACDVADRLGLIWGWQGRVRVSQPVEFSLYPATHRRCTGPDPATDKSLAHLLTRSLRIH